MDEEVKNHIFVIPAKVRPGGSVLWRTFAGVTNSAVAALTIGVLSPLAFAGSDSGADFLKIPLGARAIGVGQAYTALASDANALYWNPAGLAHPSALPQGRPWGLTLSHQDLFLDNTLDYLAVMRAGQKRPLSWGVSLLRLSYGKEDERGPNRERIRSFRSSDQSLGAAVAYNFNRFQAGTHVKLVRQELAGEVAQGMAVDLGLKTSALHPRLSLGAAVRNLGPQLKLNDERFRLPLTFSVGSAFQVARPLVLSFDVQSRPYQDQVIFSVGTEISPASNLSLRAGYLSKLADAVSHSQKSETFRGDHGFTGFTGGLGISLKKLALDYSMAPFGELGLVQTLTLSTWFGGVPEIGVPPPTAPTRVIFIFVLPPATESWWYNLKP